MNTLPEELFDKEARDKPPRHPEHVGPDVGAMDQLADEVFQQIRGLQAVCDLDDLPSHMLLIDIILMFQVADGSAQFLQGPNLLQSSLF